MSIRKRTWTDSTGTAQSAWQVSYTDASGKRRRKQFSRKKEAEQFDATARVEVGSGVHVPDSDTVTVTAAGKLWIKSGQNEGLERSTLDQRRQHLDLHITPFIGETKLNRITVPAVRAFQEQLREAGRSPAMVKRATVSLGSIFSDAQGRGLSIRNPVHERPRARRGAEKRLRTRLTVGVDIPSPDEIKAFLSHLSGRWRPILLTAVFTGMRASELRGLAWSAVDLEKRIIHVRQRADAYGQIGRPKSRAGDRSIPIPPMVANTLREWKLACPKGELNLVFPNGAGKIESLANIINRGLVPAMIAAGVTLEAKSAGGDTLSLPKYTGMHTLRHFYASWCINPVAQGGQGLTPKVVQERLGHASIVQSLDRYGHLFPSDDDDAALDAAAAALLT